MPFHYTRLPHGQGVGRADGPPPGAPLGALHATGIPPVGVALELFVAVTEILVIAVDDGELHGDVTLGHVHLTPDGVVAIGGFGTPRAATSAPERVPHGPPTDAYGAALVAASILCPGSLDEAATSAVAHDERVFDVVMAADLDGLDDAARNDVRWFLIHLLSFERAQRPTVERAWSCLQAHASRSPADLAAWSAATVRAVPPTTAPVGVRVSEGPLTRALAFAAIEPEQRTAFWTRGQAEALRSPTRPDVDEPTTRTRPLRAHDTATHAPYDRARVGSPTTPGRAIRSQEAPLGVLATLSPAMTVVLGAAGTLLLLSLALLAFTLGWYLTRSFG